jgi:hypothetical protein
VRVPIRNFTQEISHDVFAYRLAEEQEVAGAVHLFNSTTGNLISTLHGSTAGDLSGSSVPVVSNGNYVVLSTSWDNPDSGQSNAGAVTLGQRARKVSVA